MSKHLTGYTVRISIRPVIFDTVPPGAFVSETPYHLQETIDGMLIDASLPPDQMLEHIARRLQHRLSDVLQQHRSGYAKI